MQSHWLILGTMTAGATLLCASTADAANLVSWQFDSHQNRLTFNTDARVQPRAQVIANPSRLVIDLPGTRLGRATMNQNVGGVVQSVRAGQFNADTARLVVEFAPGYAIDPNGVRVVGRTPNQWTVELPNPTRLVSNVSSAGASLAGLQITQNGLFWRFDSSQSADPRVLVNRSRDRRQIFIDLDGLALSQAGSQAIGRYGVRQVTAQQASVSPPITRLTLDVTEDSPDWIASVSRGGVAIVPLGGMMAIRDDTPSPIVANPVVNTPQPPTGSVQVPPPVNPQPTPPTPAPPPPAPTPAPRPPVSNSRVRVTIDPGHGGRDPGAVGIGGLRESDVILPISQEVARILERNGVMVQMTRANDTFVTLEGRAAMANRNRSDLFVSIHANSAGNRPTVNGAETFHHPGSTGGYRLAESIQSRIIRQTGMNNRGVKQANFYVLRNTAMPAALVEVGFVTGSADAARLRNPSFRSQMAQAIADGILDYIRRYGV